MASYSAKDSYMTFFLEYPASMFTECSGGERKRTTTTVHPGGGGSPEIVEGPTEYGQVTLRKPYDPIVDSVLDLWAAAYDNGVGYRPTLVKIPVMSDGAPLPSGKPTTFKNCALVSYKLPDMQKGSADVATLEITLQPQTVS